jgi:adenylyl-sulfate reductase (glutathione)
MEDSYNELAEQLQGSHVRVAKFQADVDRDFAQERFGLKTFPTVVMLPKAGNQVRVPWHRSNLTNECS